jgi:hypothetical protein
MPIRERLYRGAHVKVNGAHYYVRLNGTAVYLHATDDLSLPPVRTMSKYALMRDGDIIGDPVSVRDVVRVSERRPVFVPDDRRTRRVSEHDMRFLYVARDMSLSSSKRALKVGISSNLAATLQTYHRRVPRDVFVIIVECEGAARPLEQALLNEFASARVDGSEVVRVRVHQMTTALRRLGYVRGADAIFRRA